MILSLKKSGSEASGRGKSKLGEREALGEEKARRFVFVKVRQRSDLRFKRVCGNSLPTHPRNVWEMSLTVVVTSMPVVVDGWEMRDLKGEIIQSAAPSPPSAKKPLQRMSAQPSHSPCHVAQC